MKNMLIISHISTMTLWDEPCISKNKGLAALLRLHPQSDHCNVLPSPYLVQYYTTCPNPPRLVKNLVKLMIHVS